LFSRNLYLENLKYICDRMAEIESETDSVFSDISELDSVSDSRTVERASLDQQQQQEFKNNENTSTITEQQIENCPEQEFEYHENNDATTEREIEYYSDQEIASSENENSDTIIEHDIEGHTEQEFESHDSNTTFTKQEDDNDVENDNAVESSAGEFKSQQCQRASKHREDEEEEFVGVESHVSCVI